MNRCQEIERSLHKKFSKTIWSRFVSGVKQYELLSPGDSVAVCISGGKDSMLLAKCMQLLHRFSDFPFELKFLVMDPGYLPQNRALIEENARLMEIPINVFEANIFNFVFKEDKSPCYLCSRMRRGNLYSEAKKLGCNKIALGHHFDDMIETVLMSIIYGSQVRTMLPKLHSDNFEGMELIRPLYMVRERDIIRWKEYNNLTFLQCACRFTEQSENHEELSKRREIKGLIAQLEKRNSQVPQNIFRSVHSINLATVLGYTLNGEEHSFLESYDDKVPRKKLDNIKEVRQGDLGEALGLVNRVFSEFVACDYGEEGRKTFTDYLKDKENETANDLLSAHKKMWAYRSSGKIVGVIAVHGTNHISLMFVDKEYHRKGIAKKLMEACREYAREAGCTELTVNSSPYAVKAYEHMGFTAAGDFKTQNGITFIPMRAKLQ